MKLANQLICLILLTLLPLGSSAQNIDTLEIGGKEYFVYPFNKSVDIGYAYWNANERAKSKEEKFSYEAYLYEVEISDDVPDSMVYTKKEFRNLQKLNKTTSYKKLVRLFSHKFGDIPTKEEFDEYLHYRKKGKGKKSYRKQKREYKFLYSRKFVAAIRKNPWPLLIQSFEEDHDIIPVLDPIPDGDYVQLYEEFCFMDSKGHCSWDSNYVAGFFTIKDNLLHGEATWIGLNGDTLKQGNFQNGLKEGVWSYRTYKTGYFNEAEVELYIERGYPEIDSTYEVVEYKNGLKNGTYTVSKSIGLPVTEGHYKDNSKSGEWLFRVGKPDETHISEEEASIDMNQIEVHYTLNDNDSLLVKPILIREGIFRIWEYDELEFNFSPEYRLLNTPTNLYEPGFEREVDLDLDEEKENSREFGDDYYGYEDDYYGDEFYNDFDLDQSIIFDPVEEKYKKRGVVIDSIGAYPKYVDSYEMYYPNGQLIYKYEFEGGLLKEEPNIYWDNGTIHDEVIFKADSNQYLRNVYDYDGKLYKSLQYDSLGDFEKVILETQEEKYITIDGLKVLERSFGDTWYYSMPDSLYETPMTETVLNYRSWGKPDTIITWEGYYDPINRVRSIKSYAVDGSVMYEFSGQFSENFESWTGKGSDYFGNLELESIRSGSFSERFEVDSIPERHVKRMFNMFDVANDYTLKQNGDLYSGVLKIDLTKNKIAIKNGLLVELPAYNIDGDKLYKNYLKSKEKGSLGDVLELSRVNATSVSEGSAGGTYNDMFYPLLGNFFTFNRPYDYGWEEEYYDEKPKRVKKKDEKARTQIIEGTILDGKPNGIWTSYDQFGEAMIVVPFANGEANGKVHYYKYAKPFSMDEMYYDESFIVDTFPAKRTRYLSKVEDYVNGNLDGKAIEYNWVGEVLMEADYKEGYKHGNSVERNKLAVSISQYEDGYLDGSVRTYLTLPGKDSLLLYDLLFQNGLLQGESKSYHTNGNISKRGFFLSGEPIEDYEGFDSLGFRYHYVKFNYSYPVEEKIWEENELSVRYMFDWQDSILFSPIDITNSESLDILLYNHGIGHMDEAYYGRPSLVDKRGIDYRLTKYYPNDTIARDGHISEGKKTGCWDYYSYEGEKLHQIDYFDSIIVLNDSIKYNSKGIYTELDANGSVLYESYIIEKSERYDCSHSDHHETRQLKTIWEVNDSLNRMNGSVMNYYDNGTIQSSGTMKDGLPEGEWRFYDPNGKLNKYGYYVLGKRNGRWLSGDLSKTKYLGEICLNPNMPDLEEEIKYRENLLDIEITYYDLGKSLNKEFYNVNMNFRNDIYDEEEESEVEDEEIEEVEETDEN